MLKSGHMGNNRLAAFLVLTCLGNEAVFEHGPRHAPDRDQPHLPHPEWPIEFLVRDANRTAIEFT